ncbi:MAG: PAS domain S-box protein [Acidobacteriota bacterium]
MAENIEEVFFLISPDWNEVLYISPAYEEVWGRSCQSLYDSARSWLEAVVEEDRPGVIASLEQAITESLPSVCPEYRLLRPDGVQRWIQAQCWPILDDHGNVCRVAGIAEDITDRKRAEEAQRREQSLLDSVMRTTDVMLVLLDPQFNFVWVNPAYAETCRMKPEEMIGKNHFVLYPNAENEAIFRKVRDTGEGVFYKDKAFVIPDQPERGVTYWDWSLTPAKDAAENVTSLILSLRETTEFKRTEEMLRENEQRLALAASATGIGMFDWNIATDEGFWDERRSRLLGLSTTTLSQPCHYRDWAERVHPEDLPGVETELRCCMAKHAPFDAEYRVVWPDGSVHWIAGRGVFQYDAQDQPQRMLGIVMDLTERKRSEEALRESEKRFRRLFEEDLTGNFIAKPDGQIVICNPAFVRMFGFSGYDQAVGSNLTTLHVRPEAFAEFIRLLKERKALDRYECEYRRRNGDLRHVVENVIGTFDEQGELVEFKGYMFDDTERKRAEESIRHAKEAAEAANAAKSRFLTNMSHELRTPMNSILGLIDVALPKATDPTVQDCLQTAKGSADLLLTLLNDLLDSAKIESGKLELELTPFSLRRVLDETTRILSLRASEKGLSFYCRVPDRAPGAVIGDRMRLQQVLLNLVGNAIKFTDRGEVEMSLRSLSHNDDAHLEFAVRDTGIGISPSALEHLSNPSPKPMLPRRGVSEARAWGSPSARAWLR